MHMTDFPVVGHNMREIIFRCISSAAGNRPLSVLCGFGKSTRVKLEDEKTPRRSCVGVLDLL